MPIARIVFIAAALAAFADPAFAEYKPRNTYAPGSGAFFLKNTNPGSGAAGHHFGRGVDISAIDGVPVNGASKPNLLGNPHGHGSPTAGGAHRRSR
jgi:hypothetical protein